MPVKMIQDFLKLEAASGIILMLTAVAAMVIANSPLSPWYDLLLDIPVVVAVGTFEIAKPLLLWINDGLMALFNGDGCPGFPFIGIKNASYFTRNRRGGWHVSTGTLLCRSKLRQSSSAKWLGNTYRNRYCFCFRYIGNHWYEGAFAIKSFLNLVGYF